MLFNSYHNSFGAQAVEQFPANAPAVVVGTISQAAVQALKWLSRSSDAYRPGTRFASSVRR